MSKKEKKKVYHHDEEQLTFYQNVIHIKTHKLKKEEYFLILVLR